MPVRVPPRSADPRIGVSERRLRNPVWMSRARSVPAFIVAKSAPWMNGTASAKARNESVGKPGSSVDAVRPPALTSSSRIGKTSGKMIAAGCRNVRRTERRATAPICVATTLMGLPRTGAEGERCSTGRDRPDDLLGLGVLVVAALVGTLERAARLREEDVVERRCAQLDVVDVEPRGVQAAHDVGERETVAEPDGDLRLPPAGEQVAEPVEELGDALLLVSAARDGVDA